MKKLPVAYEIGSYTDYFPPDYDEAPVGASVRIMFLGANSLLIHDEKTFLLIDPYFTRQPGMLGLQYFYKPIAPNPKLIKQMLGVLSIPKLAGILVTHTHFDHALDVGEIARQTGAIAVGSSSTVSIAHGAQLPDEQIRRIESGVTYTFGNFSVMFIRGAHLPFPFFLNPFMGLDQDILNPIVPPVRGMDYKAGTCYSIILRHPLGSMLVQGSAGFLENALKGYRLDCAILSVGGLDLHRRTYLQRYCDETIGMVSPETVFLSHWDDFTRPLSDSIRFLRKAHRIVKSMHTYTTTLPDRQCFLLPVGREFIVFGEAE